MQTSDAEAYGKSVWSWRPLLASSRRRCCELNRGRKTVNSPTTVTRRIRRRGERAISRQTIAQGRPVVSAATCMLVCAFSCSFCARDRGCQPAPGLSCALFSEGRRFLTTRAHHARRECGDVFSFRSLRGATRRSNPALLCGRAGSLRCARNDGSPTCPLQ